MDILIKNEVTNHAIYVGYRDAYIQRCKSRGLELDPELLAKKNCAVAKAKKSWDNMISKNTVFGKTSSIRELSLIPSNIFPPNPALSELSSSSRTR